MVFFFSLQNHCRGFVMCHFLLHFSPHVLILIQLISLPYLTQDSLSITLALESLESTFCRVQIPYIVSPVNFHLNWSWLEPSLLPMADWPCFPLHCPNSCQVIPPLWHLWFLMNYILGDTCFPSLGISTLTFWLIAFYPMVSILKKYLHCCGGHF